VSLHIDFDHSRGHVVWYNRIDGHHRDLFCDNVSLDKDDWSKSPTASDGRVMLMIGW
jgi:hypothetical protein